MILTTLLFSTEISAQPFVWREAETISSIDPHFRIVPPQPSPVLSAGRMLQIDQDATNVPARGLSLALPLAVEQFGAFELWARVSHESQRSPFRWRIDQEKWAEVTSQTPGLDLVATADRGDLIWLKLGSVKLAAGTRTLDLHLPRPVEGRLRFGIDCVVASRGAFIPNGKHPPGLDWRSAADKTAESVVFELPVAGAHPARTELELGGSWQTARWDCQKIEDYLEPPRQLPDLNALPWRAIRVPGERARECPDWAFCHRQLYRCRLKVPASARLSSHLLRFPSNALLSSVFVNRELVGQSDLPFVPFECDIRSALRPGEVNEIIVVVQDWHSALADPALAMRSAHLPFAELLTSKPGLAFPLASRHPSGILQAPRVISLGPVRIANIGVRTNVPGQSLGLNVELTNSREVESAVVIRNRLHRLPGTESLLEFPDKALNIAPRSSLTADLQQDWKSPLVWWPDDPRTCVLETTLLLNDQVVDQLRTSFAFRQWSHHANRLLLNGVPWRAMAIRDRAFEDLSSLRGGGLLVNMVRSRGLLNPEPLASSDHRGIAVLRSDHFDASLASGQILEAGRADRKLFDRWHRQLAAQVLSERNHPSIFAWSIGGAIASAEQQDSAWKLSVEPELRRAVEVVSRLDPTRPVVIAGGGGRFLPELPVQSRTISPNSQETWNPSKVILAEARIADGEPLGGVLGASGMSLERQQQLQTTLETLRWADVAGIELDATHVAMPDLKPIVVMCRDRQWNFPASSVIVRHLKVCNDSRMTAELTVHWLLLTRNVRLAHEQRGKKVVTLGPGEASEFSIELLAPDQPADAVFVFTCERDGHEIFRKVRSTRITK